MHLPRGRFTDALVALSAFVLLFVGVVVGFQAAALSFGFLPLEFSSGAWQGDALRSGLSPLASAFLPIDPISAIFNLIFLLIAGRYVERAIGPTGLGITFLVACYCGAAGRLIFTPQSPIPSAGLDSALFGVIGSYFMLYGVPATLPISRRFGRVGQIAILALIWIGIQLVFALTAGSFDPSTSVVAPVFGLVAGIALARPLLAWRYRGA
ncbi:rhomboid family intramembrane serine protease [Sphingomonas gei]|uniref:rhomboid family intramembrane serine protease n=1 Tax=Sphingomonas gei TaxID=1395960 RepID=UPI001441BA7F|nr:rhomboid family intramembrane serine protease [Sphingomonas gei]